MSKHIEVATELYRTLLTLFHGDPHSVNKPYTLDEARATNENGGTLLIYHDEFGQPVNLERRELTDEELRAAWEEAEARAVERWFG